MPRRLRSRLALAALGGTLALAASLAWPLPEAATPGHRASVRITDRTGGLLREVQPDGTGTPVELADVAPDVVAALVATEDQRFYRHPGVDVLALARAATQNLTDGEVTSGGSTLTMQVARALRGRTTRASLADKLAEAHLALRLDLRRSKEEVLELWLNRVAFGNRAHGIEAAAQTYFGKAAVDLTVPEAALLVGLPQRPSALDPFRFADRATDRQRTVLAAMQRAGHVTSAEREALETTPLAFIQPQTTFRAPHFVEHVRQRVPEDALEVQTTIRPTLQLEAETIVASHLRGLEDASVTAAAAVVLDNRTGDVLAYVGSPDFWDDAARGQVDGARALRQPGSALKPFTYALAFQSGATTPDALIADLDLQVVEAGGAFSPENYDKTFHGPVPARQALASSYNVPAVRLVQQVGPEALLKLLRRSGFESLRQSAEHYGVGLTLGNGEVRLIELARAYAGVARGGSLPPVNTVRWIRTTSGDTLQRQREAPTDMGLTPAVTYLLADILSDPEARAPGFGRGGPLELPFPVAVKTGTSKDYRDNWAVGFTPHHTVAVWVGNADGSPMRWVSGTRGAGPIFNALMRALGPGGEFTRPRGIVEREICSVSGDRPGAFCPTTRRAIGLPVPAQAGSGHVHTDTCTVHQRVAVDARTGLLAEATTPAEHIEQRVFVVYPAEYHAWMRERGLALPPMATATVAARDSLRYSDRLRITYPEPGTAFVFDPVLRPEYQRVRLKGHADADLLDVRWVVNGTPLASSSDDRTLGTTDWPLTPGRHTIELQAVTREGRRLRSRPSPIVVRGAALAAAAVP
ncbi:MAG: penicillin-binding protein 1C [Bacteroidota bacterium]